MPPALYALLSPRQNANSLSNANKLLIRCAWSGNTYFTTDYDSSWSGLGACSPAPLPPPLPPPSPPWAFTFLTKASLKAATQAFNDNKASAIVTYGPIAYWGVTSITDMAELFKGMGSFNADISGWITSGVTTMRSMFEVRPAAA